MCKVTISDEAGMFKTCLASEETPYRILEHFKIDTKTKIIYMNGKALTKDQMHTKIPENGTVHLVAKNKTVMRG